MVDFLGQSMKSRGEIIIITIPLISFQIELERLYLLKDMDDEFSIRIVPNTLLNFSYCFHNF